MSVTGSQGKVYLVGAGPGDPGLITVRGKECLERADVVVYDSLANDAFLAWAPRAELIHVGKSRDRHTLMQDEINEVLVREAKSGRRVVRLKGGDPFVFGRGGEEALALAEAGIPFEVVPGITSSVAVPAYAGIPVTHRGLTQSYTVATGHGKPGPQGALDLADLPKGGTLVFMMSVKNLANLMNSLQECGHSPDTPAAVIEWGTYPRQRTVVGTIGTLAERAQAEGFEPPAVTVVGEVVTLHEKIDWYTNQPLFGKRIVVTRARAQASAFVHKLQELGADIFEFPTIKIEPPKDQEDFGYIGDYDWVVLTSVNGVQMLLQRLAEQGHDARDLAGVKLCVIGSKTADEVKKHFLNIDVMPDKYVAEELLAALEQHPESLEGKRFLLPRADIARSFLPKELRARGAEVVELVAYRTVKPALDDEIADALMDYAPHLVTFTSSSTAKNFAAMMGEYRVKALAETAAFGAIGPITAETAEGLGMPIAIEPEQHDIPTFVDAIVDWGLRPGGS